MSDAFWSDEFNEGGSSTTSNKAEFVDFPEGITKLRIIDKAPYVRWVHWMPGTAKVGMGRSANCPGRACPVCAIRQQQKANKEDYSWGMQKKWAIQVINRATGRLEILDQGREFMDEVRTIINDNSKHGYADNYDLKIRRTGVKTSTKYRVDMDEVFPLSDKDKELALGARDLAEYFAPHDVDKLVRILNGEKWEDVFASQPILTEDAKETANNEVASGKDEEIEVK